MFCYKCGCKLNEDSIFCHRCGTKIQATPITSTASNESPSNQLDQRALQIYLSNILSLECIKAKYIKKLEDINWQLYKINDKAYFHKYEIKGNNSWNDHNHSFYFKFDGHFYLDIMYTPNDRIKFWPIIVNNIGSGHKPYWLNLEQNLTELIESPVWTNNWITDLGFFAKIFLDWEIGEKVKAVFQDCYQDFKKIAPPRLQANIRKSNQLRNSKNSISSELSSVNKLLTQAYSVNIIPGQFRDNLYAIYYLYDFIRTSNLPLSSAMLHLDLNEIKERLDTIIEQQQDSIINQSIRDAQNHEQHQAYLTRLSAIAHNTANAATYSAIAASNAETCAWIGIANYLK